MNPHFFEEILAGSRLILPAPFLSFFLFSVSFGLPPTGCPFFPLIRFLAWLSEFVLLPISLFTSSPVHTFLFYFFPHTDHFCRLAPWGPPPRFPSPQSFSPCSFFFLTSPFPSFYIPPAPPPYPLFLICPPFCILISLALLDLRSPNPFMHTRVMGFFFRCPTSALLSPSEIFLAQL